MSEESDAHTARIDDNIREARRMHPRSVAATLADEVERLREVIDRASIPDVEPPRPPEGIDEIRAERDGLLQRIRHIEAALRRRGTQLDTALLDRVSALDNEVKRLQAVIATTALHESGPTKLASEVIDRLRTRGGSEEDHSAT